MNGVDSNKAVPSAADCAEAAAWIAKLHSDDRTQQVEAGFRRWLAATPAHRAAFEMANELWVGAEQLPKPEAPPIVRWPHSGIVLTLPRALATACSVALIAVAAWFALSDPGIETGVGEQRYLTLEDGSRVTLNTATRIVVHFDEAQRGVELDYGEALFEVAKNPSRPFVVIADNKRVRALGTSFLVRRESSAVAVTLVEGNVSVSTGSTSEPPPTAASETHEQNRSAEAGALTMSPGQRLTFSDGAAPTLDRPQIENVTAWQRGQVIFDHTPLPHAIREMNRYSAMVIELGDTNLATLAVTGVFRVGDTEDFARAVAEAYGLHIAESPKRLVLSERR